ncbi:deoxyribose-phosphate aldolase [Caproiciproducens sp. CPB-2]|uniref:deoxyribose-phosphate aldolase n=1 Tax=Caproiciproducens sp. CPB-2 TaxID=3030017 RepID=UPI0023DC2719|nr:deoxyribose-phosphate aldolase [Caproiciproducens sp. CPB-2]MDF1495534.1 deoxyribose-phosphate aldolase [Caproiciproducens sp. CPB-2]
MELETYIDHTLLKPNATKGQIETLCKEAREHHFASVCVNSYYVPLANTLLKDSGVTVCCVVGFPLGAMSTQGKASETKQAVQDGAGEVDMVINIGALLDGDYEAVLQDIRAVAREAHPKALLKVIIETCLLNDEQKVKACELAVEAGADFVKTSTGFSTGGATVRDVGLMKRTVQGKAKVKASGGVRTYEDAMNMIHAGADRIGTSNGVKMMEH